MLKNLRIKNKLLLLILGFLLIGCSVTTALSMYFFNRYVASATQEGAVNGMEGFDALLTEYRQSAESNARLLAANPDLIAALAGKDSAKLLQVATPLAKSTSLDFITLTDETGAVVARTHAPEKKGDVINNEANVRQALQGKTTSAVEPGSSVKLGIRAGVPVTDTSGKLVGVVSAGYDLGKDTIVDTIKKHYNVDATVFQGDVRLTSTIQKDGKRIVGTQLDPKIAAIVLTQGKAYQGTAEILGQPYRTAYKPLLDWENKPVGLIFSGKSQQAAAAILQNFLVSVGGAVIVILLLCSAIAVLLAAQITKPLELLQELMSRASKGDLSVRSSVASHDEVGLLAASFNEMLENQSRVVGIVKNSAFEIAAASEELAATSEEANANSQLISGDISNIAKSSEVEFTAMMEVSRVLLELSSLIQLAKDRSSTAKESSETTLQSAQHGRMTVNEATNCMNLIREKSGEGEDIIREMYEYANKIGSISTTITTIAQQTNLLALNASIEAARAGEAGRGFAVVANEVAKLAEQSNREAAEVGALVDKVSACTNQAVQAMQETRKQVEAGGISVDKASTALSSILSAVNQTVHEMQSIAEITGEEVASSEKIVTLISTVSSKIEETKTAVDRTEQASTEVAHGIETVAASTEELAALSSELRRSVETFKV